MHRFVRYAVNVMGVEKKASDEETALAGIAAMEEFYHEIGMPINMKELGVEPTEEQIKELASGCARACGGCIGAALPLHEDDMEKIYRAAR